MAKTVTPAEATAPPMAEQEADPRRWIALFVVMSAAFMVLLDISIVNVAIPAIQRNLHANFAEVQFVLAGYQLAYAVVLITGSRLGDLYGRRRMFMIGMAGFTIASALCGFAQNPTMLVASRVLQGLMAALMFPQALSVIQVNFPPRERAAAFGLFGATIGVATITGPLVGGLIIRDDVTGQAWRFIFLVNLPIGIAAIAAAAVLLRESRAPGAARLDLVGVLLVSAGLFLLAYPLVEGRDAGWPAWAYVMLVASVPVLAAFVLFERQQGRLGRNPLVDLTLFRNRSFSAGTLMSTVFLSGVPSFFLIFGLMLQIGHDFSALRAGLTTIPFSMGTAVASGISVRLAPRLGKRILAIGSALLVIGMLAVIAIVRARGNDLSGPELIPALLVCGLGLGSVVAPLVTVILAGVPPRIAGAASGVLTTTQQIGGAIGVAIIGVIFFGMLGSRADIASASAHLQLRSDLAAAGLPTGQIDSAVATFDRCFSDRAHSHDPTAVPASCPQTAADNAVTRAFASAASAAKGRDYTQSLERALLYNIGVFALSALLVLALPRGHRRREEARGLPAAH